MPEKKKPPVDQLTEAVTKLQEEAAQGVDQGLSAWARKLKAAQELENAEETINPITRVTGKGKKGRTGPKNPASTESDGK